MIETKGLFNFVPEIKPYKNFMVFVSMDYDKSGVKLRGGDTDYSKMENTFNLIKAQIRISLGVRSGCKSSSLLKKSGFDFLK